MHQICKQAQNEVWFKKKSYRILLLYTDSECYLRLQWTHSTELCESGSFLLEEFS